MVVQECLNKKHCVYEKILFYEENIHKFCNKENCWGCRFLNPSSIYDTKDEYSFKMEDVPVDNTETKSIEKSTIKNRIDSLNATHSKLLDDINKKKTGNSKQLMATEIIPVVISIIFLIIWIVIITTLFSFIINPVLHFSIRFVFL